MRLLSLVLIAGILSVSFILSLPTNAVVPGINTGIDYNTSGTSPNMGSTASNFLTIDSSQDGRFVVFQSPATDITLPAGSGYQLYVRDRLTNTTELISKSSSGVTANTTSVRGRISDDGRYVVFDSNGTNLVTSDTNNEGDVFIRDRKLGTTSRVSLTGSAGEANGASFDADVNIDGTKVVFTSRATNLVSTPVVTTTTNKVYMKDMTTGEVVLLSKNSSGVIANGDSATAQISCEGRIVIFYSRATNLAIDSITDRFRTYVLDLSKPHDPRAIRGTANGDNMSSYLSCNGSYISYASTSSNLVTGDTNGKQDVFLYDRINDTVKRVSVDSAGVQGNDSSALSAASTNLRHAVSNDGKYVVFESAATNLVTGDTNGVNDIFIRNVQVGTTEIISKNSTGAIGNAKSQVPTISSDGKYINYYSNATNLVSGFTGTVFASRSGADFDY